MNVSAPKVFISYRREETAPHAGRLYDAMVARFGEGNVFMDLDLAPGIDFVNRITDAVGACRALLVVMGPAWASIKDDEGEVRIADPEDFVRLEVETALRRRDVTVIPVLVGGAHMPDRDDLPQGIQPITRRNALELSEGRWRYDIGRLADALDEVVGDSAGSSAVAAEAGAEPHPERPPDVRLIVEGALVMGLAALIGRYLANHALRFDIGPDPGQTLDSGAKRWIAAVVEARAETWAIASAALAVWLAVRTARDHYARTAVRGILVGAVAGAIGGAIYAVPVFLGQDDALKFAQATSTSMARWINVGSFAVAGGLIGALIGGLWRPPRVAAALGSGAVAAALAVLPFVTGPTNEWVFALNGAAIAGVTLATLLALDAQRSAAESGSNLRAARP